MVGGRRRFVASSLAIASAALVASRRARADDAESAATAAARIQAAYDGVSTLRASFTQAYYLKAQDATKHLAGTVALVRPNKLSFRYTEPAGNRVVTSGKKLFAYDKETQQVFETSVEKSQYPAAFAFLNGAGNLERDFDLRVLASDATRAAGALVLDCSPKKASPAFETMVLYADASTARVSRVLFLDAQANTNRFDLKDVKLDEKIDPKEFDFTPPKGAKVVKA
ncbi:MAG: outer membrane lipoprotein carrier protein LolA [Polyangiaceae bacterium]